MSAVAFDNTMLSMLLNPDGRVPLIPGTDSPIELAKQRAESVVVMIEKSELALLNRGIFAASDNKDRMEPYQKRKVDRQIVAICKVYGVTELYTDDAGLARSARLCGITPISIADIPIPETARQGSLELEPHQDIPEPLNDDGQKLVTE